MYRANTSCSLCFSVFHSSVSQKDYWWVSLIIIGLVLLATPLYIHMCPAGLSDADRIAVFTQAGLGPTYAAVESSDKDAEVAVAKPDEKGIELTPAESPVANQV